METNLNKLPLLKSGNVKELLLDRKAKNRLLSLGFIPGTDVKPIFSNSSGTLKAYEIRKTIIALRDTDADKIKVKTKL